jgi:hypothetical protein
MDPGEVVWLPDGSWESFSDACQGLNVCAAWEGDGGWYIWCCPY